MHEEFETVQFEFDEENGISRLTLNRPDSLNALNNQMRQEIEASFDTLAGYDSDMDGAGVRVVVIEGTGEQAFCAGADINEFSDFSPAAFETHSMRDSITEFAAPVIAKVQGYCLGGGFELALACDFRLAAESSRFGFPEVDLGLIPGAGGVQYVARLANPSFARELAMTGEYTSANQAAEEGIINQVHPDDKFDTNVEEFTEEIASKAPLAIRAIKDSGNVALETSLRDGLKYDRRVFATLLETEDHKEGARGFVEDDYDPEFTGR